METEKLELKTHLSQLKLTIRKCQEEVEELRELVDDITRFAESKGFIEEKPVKSEMSQL